MDRFPNEALPVLYLRARVGRPGVISLTGSIGATVTNYTMQSYIGYIANGSTPLSLHGFPQIKGDERTTGSQGGWLGVAGGSADTMKGEYTTSAYGYFRHPTLSAYPLTAANGVPIAKDEYILISAGKDRTYGTQDDITTFSR